MTDKVTMIGPHTNMTAEEALKYVLQEDVDDVFIVARKGSRMITRSSKMTRGDAWYMVGNATKYAMDDMV